MHDFGAVKLPPPPEAEGSISERAICCVCGVLVRAVRVRGRRVRLEYSPPIVNFRAPCPSEPRWQAERIPCRR